MKYFILPVLIVAVSLHSITCPPVTKKPPKEEDEPTEERSKDDMNFGLEYEKYLKEIVSVLESDDEFRKKLEESNVSDIKSGEIARHLEFVSHGVRTKLDEIKRKEIDRLRQMMRVQQRMQMEINRIDPELKLPTLGKDKVLSHIDHKNPNSFEVDDLAKLIQQATHDLEEIDKKRKEEFKKYEMEKEMERRERLQQMDDSHRDKEQQRLEDMEKKHKQHPKVNHPGNKEQLEEVWEESDGMAKDDFNPKTFFFLHDANSDGVLDEEEVEALFQKELDKVYDPKNEEDDMVERYEEMNRMREHVFNEVDRDQNKLISLEEFLQSTKEEGFEKDEDWETLDEQRVYTDEELEQYARLYEERRKLAEVQDIPVVQDNFGGAPHPQGGVNQMQQQPQGGFQGRTQVQGQGQPQFQGQRQFQSQGQPQFQGQGQPQFQGQGQPQFQGQGRQQSPGQNQQQFRGQNQQQIPGQNQQHFQGQGQRQFQNDGQKHHPQGKEHVNKMGQPLQFQAEKNHHQMPSPDKFYEDQLMDKQHSFELKQQQLKQQLKQQQWDEEQEKKKLRQHPRLPTNL